MPVWLVDRTDIPEDEPCPYDEYDQIVVAARSAEEALAYAVSQRVRRCGLPGSALRDHPNFGRSGMWLSRVSRVSRRTGRICR